MDLNELGWDEHFLMQFDALKKTGLLPARILTESARIYTVLTETSELKAEVAGKLVHLATGKKDFPVVGDWVLIDQDNPAKAAVIHEILPRKSAFTRKKAGRRTEAQVIAANIDTVFLVCGLDDDFNPSRIERYLTVAWESGAKPVIVLNKTDISGDVPAALKMTESIAPNVPVLTVSANMRAGLGELLHYIKPGETVAFLGSSGVGKSSLINELLGVEKQLTQKVRDDSRGRHTTRHGELFFLPEGGILMDTPGLRELQLWSEGEGLEQVFDDIEELAKKCRFRDCRHDQEPGCSVKNALESGELPARRWGSFLKMKKEISQLAIRQDTQSKLIEKKQKKEISLKIKRLFQEPRKK